MIMTSIMFLEAILLIIHYMISLILHPYLLMLKMVIITFRTYQTSLVLVQILLRSMALGITHQILIQKITPVQIQKDQTPIQGHMRIHQLNLLIILLFMFLLMEMIMDQQGLKMNPLLRSRQRLIIHGMVIRLQLLLAHILVMSKQIKIILLQHQNTYLPLLIV